LVGGFPTFKRLIVSPLPTRCQTAVHGALRTEEAEKQERDKIVERREETTVFRYHKCGEIPKLQRRTNSPAWENDEKEGFAAAVFEPRPADCCATAYVLIHEAITAQTL
jgi:hypothetical protein